MYYEFKALEGKALFNIDTLNYGNTIFTKHDISAQLVSLSKEKAEEYYNEYQQMYIKNYEDKQQTSTLDNSDFEQQVQLLKLKVLEDSSASKKDIQIIEHK